MTRRNISWFIAFLTLLSISGCTSVKHSASANQDSRVRIIVIHFTTVDFESSLRVLTEPSSNPVSSHYLIPEPDDESYGKSRLRTYQLVDEDRRAWHAGSSYWGGKAAVNDQSIGIEIVNRSWCQKSQGRLEVDSATAGEFCFFPDFPDGQIALLVDLLEDILERHPDIRPTDIVGHSDVAPGRKVDPGPRFPWQRLARLGFGAWYDEETVLKYWNRFLAEPLPLVNVQKALAAYGYQIEPTGECDRQTGDVLQSFQLHFRSHEVTRMPSVETAATLFALIEKYYPEQLENLLYIAPAPAIGEDTHNQAACTTEPRRAINATPGWSTDVAGVDEMHLSVDHWINAAHRPDEVLLDANAIASFVRNAYDVDSNMVDLNTYPETIGSGEVVALIRSISKPHQNELHYRRGGRVTGEDFDRYTANLDLERVPELVDVRFGMIVERADMRTWPSEDVVFESEETIDLDRFQENGLFPGDVVAVLHESSDGLWYFAQSYNYAAWVRKHKVALGERKEILAYGDAEPFLVVTGSRVVTNYNPNTPAVSEVQLEMGTRLPLLTPEDVDHNVDGQNPYTSYIVRLPTRTEQGGLEFRPGLLARNQDVSVGYMPYTRRNVLNQAFKFLGERYGWGHSFNARDCTGLVLEVYKTFGFKLPRNSGQQGQSEIGKNFRFPPGASGEDKMRALAEADIGDLLYSRGHVMLYLGTYDGEHYVIHDLSGSGWIDDDGEFHEGVLNGVSVTPLRRIHSSPEETYFDQMYAIKRLR